MVATAFLRNVLGLLGVLLAAYVVIGLLARVFETRLIFFPDYPGRLTGNWQPSGLPVEDVFLHTSDGIRLHAWWIPSPGAAFTFLAFHGNAANIANRAPTYRFLHGLPANVLAVDYRGYGRSEGSPDEVGLYRDAEAAYDYAVRERSIPPERVIVFGQSLGTAVAVDLAAKHPVGGVVLEAPFASARAVARRVYPFLPGITAFLRTKFDTAAKLPRVRAPLLVVHCANDPVLPVALGEEVFRLGHKPKSWLRIEGACHEEASQVAPAEYRDRLQQWLRAGIQTPEK